MPRHLTARRAACLVLATTLLAACSDDGDPTAVETTSTESPSSPSPSPSPTPTKTIRPVVGERATAVLPLGSRPLLGLGGNPEPDQAAIDTAIETVGDWLDAHLDGLQRDGKGSWGAIAADGLANSKQRRPVTTDLTDPEHPVTAARYVMTVYHDGAPQYLTARVEVTRDDDSTADVGLVFVLDEAGSPTLTMFGPDPAAEAAG